MLPAIVLPTSLKYMNKLESAPARQYTSTVQPLNGTGDYKNGSKVIINIPTSPNTVLVPSESYLRFKLGGMVNGAVANPSIRLDKCGAHGCYQRLRVTHGSTLIEDIDNYGNLVGLMMALQQTTDTLGGKANILAGTTSSLCINNGEAICQTVGEKLSPPAADLAANAAVPSRTYAINLMSYVGSLGGSQYIPLFAMTSAPLTLELQLVNSALQFLNSGVALAAATNNAFVISEVEFVGTFIELSDEAVKIIKLSQGDQPLQYVIQQYANVPGNAVLSEAADTSISLPVSAKYASLKSLFCTIRASANGIEDYFPYSSEHYNLKQWRIRIGSQILPSKAPNSIAEHYAELIKAIGSLSDINHEPSINMLNYNVIRPTNNAETAAGGMVTTTRSNCFALGFDCETYAGSNKDRIFTGMDTLNSDVFWLMDFAANGNTGPISAKFDFYALYDQVILFENGSVRILK